MHRLTVAHSIPPFPCVRFSSSDGDAEEYSGGRQLKDFVDFVTDKVGDEPENFDGVDFSTFKVKALKKLLVDRGENCLGCTEVNSKRVRSHRAPTPRL